MEETKRCPYCGEEILAVAKKCKHCGEWLDKSTKPNEDVKVPALSKNRLHKKKYIVCASIAFVFIVFCLTCPGKDAHVEAINKDINQTLTDVINSVTSGNDNDPLSKNIEVMGIGIASNLIESYIQSDIDITNFVVFSIAKSKGKLLSVGILGNVFTTTTDNDLTEMKQYINNHYNLYKNDGPDPFAGDYSDEYISDTVAVDPAY